jgi:ureidoglycolate hydrolase
VQEELLEITTFDGQGYKPLIDFDCWRVAFLRYIDELLPENIVNAEKHLETDEVFVLLAGKAVLIIGSGDDEVLEMTPYTMEPYILYNVKQNAWHNIVMSQDATILLVENRNTSRVNTAYYDLNSDQRDFIQQVAQGMLSSD